MKRRTFAQALTGLGLSILATFAVIAAITLDGVASAQDRIYEHKKIGPYVPTPQEVVDKMVELAGDTKGDVVYDPFRRRAHRYHCREKRRQSRRI
jgi:hypothetical protein